jgi:hypothetical protein
MDFDTTIDLIIKDLTEAGEIIEDLKKYPGIPMIQAELAKMKCKSAADVISLLKQHSGEYTKPQQPAMNKETNIINSDNKPFMEEEIITLLPDKKETIIEPLTCNSTDDIGIEKPENISISESKEEKHEVIFEEITISDPEKKSEATIVADKFSHLSNRFNEQLGSLKDNDNITDILKIKPSSSLTDVIGINDRFLFIREIFDNSKETYDKIISQVDDANSMAEAKGIIMKYIEGKEETEAVNQLLELIKRKHS